MQIFIVNDDFNDEANDDVGDDEVPEEAPGHAVPDDGVQHRSAVPGGDELTAAHLPQRGHTALTQSGARLG